MNPTMRKKTKWSSIAILGFASVVGVSYMVSEPETTTISYPSPLECEPGCVCRAANIFYRYHGYTAEKAFSRAINCTCTPFPGCAPQEN